MLRIEEVDFNLQGLMHSVTTMLQVKANEKNIKLIFVRKIDYLQILNFIIGKKCFFDRIYTVYFET